MKKYDKEYNILDSIMSLSKCSILLLTIFIIFVILTQEKDPLFIGIFIVMSIIVYYKSKERILSIQMELSKELKYLGCIDKRYEVFEKEVKPNGDRVIIGINVHTPEITEITLSKDKFEEKFGKAS